MPRVKNEAEIVEKRGQIVTAASQVFGEKGYDGCTLDEIANLVNLKKPSLYHYVSSKSELLSLVIDRAISEVSENIEEIYRSQDDPTTKLKRTVANHLEILVKHIDAQRVYHNERKVVPKEYLPSYLAKRKRYEDIIKGILLDGMEQEVFQISDVRLTTFLILGVCNWVTQWYDPQGSNSVNDIIDEFTAFILRGLGVATT